jgi:hypothetical protein
MADEAPTTGTAPPNDPSTHPPSGRRSLWLLLVILLFLAGATALAVWWPRSKAPDRADPTDAPIDGKLTVVVRPNQRAVAPNAVEEPGAVPVRADGVMSLDVQFEEPACAYLVWLNCEGGVVPLYPWNHDALEVKDINAPAPARKAATKINNPPIGAGWKFGKRGGVETVLLLARRTPLDASVKLGPLLGSVPPPKVRHPGEVAILGMNRGSDAIATLTALNRGSDEEARAADKPLRAAMVRLHEHFEFIRAIRFAHTED